MPDEPCFLSEEGCSVQGECLKMIEIKVATLSTFRTPFDKKLIS